jgi:hypothetical protein
MEHSPTSATATAVLAGYENGLARKPEIASTKRSGMTRLGKGPVEKAGKKVDKAVDELKSSRQSLSAARAPDVAREQASEDGGADATDRRR